MTHPSAQSRLLIVIPAWNEEEVLGDVLEMVKAEKPSFADILVVSDGSADATADIARAAGVAVLDLPLNLGVGGAMRAGFQYARRVGYEYACQLDADGQHDPREIDTLIEAVESRYTTFARGDTSAKSLQESRRHRAFGGFSMGATTTWDVFALRPQYFYGYMPMAGESWIGREEDADEERLAELVTAGAVREGYGQGDFRILASVGSEDPALWDMTPQLDELHQDYPDLMTETSLQLWIDDGESHSSTSVANQVEHNLPLLFPSK